MNNNNSIHYRGIFQIHVRRLVVHFDSNVPFWIIITTILFTIEEYAFYKYCHGTIRKAPQVSLIRKV